MRVYSFEHISYLWHIITIWAVEEGCRRGVTYCALQAKRFTVSINACDSSVLCSVQLLLQQLICISRYLEREEGLAVHFSISCPERLFMRRDRQSPQMTKSPDESCVSMLVVRSSITDLLNRVGAHIHLLDVRPSPLHSTLPCSIQV